MPDARNSSRTSASRILPAVLLCGFAYYGTRASDTPPTPVPETLYKIGATTQRLEVRDSDSVLVQFPEWLTRVRSGDSSVIRVTAVRPDCLRITRLTEGRTTLTALDRQQREYSVELSLVTTRRP
ncbi:MAG: pilus assembly protein N-terminal domain-containing protein [Candidatus Saccharimonas sp.]|nr:pilus assembly protein N-terminal domain-containing protein [Planctomycetaceae bacterium]